MSEELNLVRHIWTVDETKALLSCYTARKHELEHTRKKKYAYTNMLEDLIGLGVLKTPVTAIQLENKIKNLLRVFKTARDNDERTGASPSIISPFQEEMEDIFGERPIIRNAHTISSLAPKPLSAEDVTSSDGGSKSDEKPTIGTCGKAKKKKKTEKVSRQAIRNERFNEKKELLLFLNSERNKRHNELICALSSFKKQ